MVLPLLAAVGRSAATKLVKGTATKLMTKEMAQFEVKRLQRNIGVRVKALEKLGVDTKGIAKYHELKGEEPTTRNGWVALANKYRTLDKNPGTRFKTAFKTQKREEVAAYNKDLRSKASDPFAVSKMGKKQITDLDRLMRSKARRQLKQMKDDPNTSFINQPIKMLEDYLDEGKGRNRTVNDMRRSINQYYRASQWSTATKEGRDKLYEQQTKLFGERAKDFTPEERSALWRMMQSKMEIEEIDSGPAIAFINLRLDEGATVKFNRDSKGNLHAYVAPSDDDAAAQAALEEAQNEIARNIIEENDRRAAKRAERMNKRKNEPLSIQDKSNFIN